MVGANFAAFLPLELDFSLYGFWRRRVYSWKMARWYREVFAERRGYGEI
jgi:hypothetical protein